MITLRSKLVALVVVFGFSFASKVLTQERLFPRHNCAVTLPKGWQEVAQPPPQRGLVAAFANTNSSRVFVVGINSEAGPIAPLDDKFIAEYERGRRDAGGGPLISGKLVDVAGIKSYERLGKIQIRGQELSVLSLSIPADGKMYILQCFARDGNAGADPELRQCLNGFRFLRSPMGPSGTRRSQSAAYRTGYLMGKLIGIVFVGVMIALAILAISRRKSASRVRTPPPLPGPVQSGQSQSPPPPVLPSTLLTGDDAPRG